MNFYEQFLVELDKVTIKADAPAAAVLTSRCTEGSEVSEWR